MLHLKKRRGAMVVMTGIMFFALVICGAVAIDFGRLWTERSELQSAADAGALAGGLQLMAPRDTLLVDSVARAFVHANRAMADTITVDSVINGNWDGPTRAWTPAGSPTNAVRVVVSQRASNLFMAGFGVPVPRMTARAIAWAGAPVTTTTSCIKPWAILTRS
jgi:Flp pilus assembly protein TadG